MIKFVLPIAFFCLFGLTACEQSSQPRDGQAVYNQSCISCHERGHGGAPKRGDLAQWSERSGKGQQVLLKRLRDGYQGMPPKGACFDCSDAELQMVLDYIQQPVEP